MNKLYYGDCLRVMQQMPKDSVDLIYLDPPFNSNRAYNAIYKDETGRPLPDQIEAFCDLWTLDEETERAIKSVPEIMVKGGIDDSVAKFWRNWMNALRHTNPKLLAYLSYMTERLLQMKILIRPTGSIYLHCDPTASHYIKVVMDGVFGQKNFRNEIIWHYSKWSSITKSYQRNHDTILFYSKTDEYNFNQQFQSSENKKKKIEKGYQVNRPNDVKQLIVYDRRKAKKKIKEGDYDVIVDREADSNVRMHDTWNDINIINSQAKERMGYPTQKPLALLERIIKGSSNEGDIIFDPFCGCGTTMEAAHKLNRQWIGIDMAIHAIKRVSAVRLQERCDLTEGVDYEISGIPQTLEGANDLHKRDPYQFQKWAVEMVDGFVTAKKSNDGGVDGRLYFQDSEDLKAMKLEVKGTKQVRIESLRALAGVIDEKDFPMGGFITLKTLGRIQKQHFQDFCWTKGTISIDGKQYPRLQVLSVSEILQGKQFDTPLIRGKSTTDQMGLFDKG